jgi:copper chaperone
MNAKIKNMKTYNFKTNINCSGCVANIKPHLDGNQDVREWKVDTTDPAKLLSVQTENLSSEEVKAIITKAGFKAEEV